MGHLIMAAAWGEITGLAVDVHVHRTVNRLKWFKKTIEKPNDIETSEINCKKLTTFSGLLTVSIFVKFPI